MNKYYKIHNCDDQYEYAHDYKTISEAISDIDKYEREDIENRGIINWYTITDDEGYTVWDNLENNYTSMQYDMSLVALQDLGLPNDEAVRFLEDMRI